MIHVGLAVNGKTFHEAMLPDVPRIGETMVFSNLRYRVVDLEWNLEFDNESSDFMTPTSPPVVVKLAKLGTRLEKSLRQEATSG